MKTSFNHYASKQLLSIASDLHYAQEISLPWARGTKRQDNIERAEWRVNQAKACLTRVLPGAFDPDKNRKHAATWATLLIRAYRTIAGLHRATSDLRGVIIVVTDGLYHPNPRTKTRYLTVGTGRNGQIRIVFVPDSTADYTNSGTRILEASPDAMARIASGTARYFSAN